MLILIDVPFAVAVVGLGRAKLPDDPIEHMSRARPFDTIGLALVATGLIAILLGFGQADSWSVLLTVVVCAGGVALLGGYRLHARRTAHPLIDMSVFDVPAFRLVLGIVAAVAVAQFARTVFIPLELQSLRGLSPLETGLALLPAAVASARRDAARRALDGPHRRTTAGHARTRPRRDIVRGLRRAARRHPAGPRHLADGREQRRDRPVHDAARRDGPVGGGQLGSCRRRRRCAR